MIGNLIIMVKICLTNWKTSYKLERDGSIDDRRPRLPNQMRHFMIHFLCRIGLWNPSSRNCTPTVNKSGED